MVYTFDLSEKVILITGGYGHLGKAITESLLWHGARVFVLGRSREKFQEVFNEKLISSGSLSFEECDIEHSSSIRIACQTVEDKTGKVDVLINNAFYLDGSEPLTMTDEDWNSGVDGTLSSVYRCIREAYPYIRKSLAPRIINVSSMYGMVAPDFSIYKNTPQMQNPPHYGASKAGVIQLTKYFASYLGTENITVNSVSPGPFPSDRVQLEKEFIAELEQKTVLKRIGKPEDLAGIFVFLASDASAYVTGQNFVVDGGWTIR